MHCITSKNLSEFIKNKEKVCLIGGLGKEIDLFVFLLDKLEIEFDLVPQKYILITSPDVQDKFQEAKLNLDKVNPEMHVFDYQEVLRENYSKVYEVCDTLIKKVEKDYEIICELTGGTKPITIALMKIGEQKNLLRIYFSGREFRII